VHVESRACRATFGDTEKIEIIVAYFHEMPRNKDFFKQYSKMAPTKFIRNREGLELTMVVKMCMSKVGGLELLFEIKERNTTDIWEMPRVKGIIITH
jgi:hypothetical protein